MKQIQCPKCNSEIDEGQPFCPHCKQSLTAKTSNRHRIVIIAIIAIIALVVSCIFGLSHYLKAKAVKQQEEISELLRKVESSYKIGDFVAVKDLYDELDELKFDTAKKRELLEYDISVHDVAYNFYNVIISTNNTINHRSAFSLNKLVKDLKNTFDQFDALEVNLDSEIGKYINDVRNNVMYVTFEREFIHNNNYDMDYGITQGAYYLILGTYTNALADIPYPYDR